MSEMDGLYDKVAEMERVTQALTAGMEEDKEKDDAKAARMATYRRAMSHMSKAQQAGFIAAMKEDEDEDVKKDAMEMEEEDKKKDAMDHDEDDKKDAMEDKEDDMKATIASLQAKEKNRIISAMTAAREKIGVPKEKIAVLRASLTAATLKHVEDLHAHERDIWSYVSPLTAKAIVGPAGEPETPQHFEWALSARANNAPSSMENLGEIFGEVPA